MDLRTSITNNFLSAALSDISSVGRHWFSLPRLGASMLETLISEQGHDVFLFELPPEWEHVLALKEESHSTLVAIAAKRANLRAEGLADHALSL